MPKRLVLRLKPRHECRADMGSAQAGQGSPGLGDAQSQKRGRWVVLQGCEGRREPVAPPANH